MRIDKVEKAKKAINLIGEQLDNCDGTEPIQLNPFMMKEVLNYIFYLENQVELGKFTPEEEDRLNILFIKGHYPDLVSAIYKSDNYGFGDEDDWICELSKPFNKITSLKGTLYQTITALEKIKRATKVKKK